MLIGYIRVSTNDQNTQLQRNALISVNCEQIFVDKISGKSSTNRPGLKKALKKLSAGDTLVVWKLDRLGRSVHHLISLIEQLKSQGIHFRSLTDNIDTGTAMGRFFFHVMSALAEMERELIVERTKAGLEAARLQGRIGGRKRVMTPEVIETAKRLFATGTPLRHVAIVLGVSPKTLYRYIPAKEQHELSASAG
ncbi:MULTISPECIES: recombinase family protein [Candidatus Fukatsuia]|uniref:recombinase family protein n=1 Tax=Candidatus Fukatsuia TaxID=1927833 RepID=UPI000E74BFB0|nr:recombinase family protein [Candidatus Fukatsuia symbiotica]